MKRGEAFPSQYIGKDDLAQPTRATIKDVVFETIKSDNGDEDKAVMFFQEDHLKKMIVNNTNWQTIEAAYGDESDNWRGHQVELYVDPGIMFGGKRVGGVRVRIPAGAPVQQAPPAAPVQQAPPAAPPLTWQQACNLAVAAGMTVDQLKTALKAKGLSGYTASTGTAAAREAVAEFQDSAESFDDPNAAPAAPDDGIPF